MFYLERFSTLLGGKKKFAKEMYIPYNPASTYLARKGSRYFLGKSKTKWYF